MCFSIADFDIESDIEIKEDLLYLTPFQWIAKISPFKDRFNNKVYAFKLKTNRENLKTKIRQTNLEDLNEVINVLCELPVVDINNKNVEINFADVKNIFIKYFENEIMTSNHAFIDGRYKKVTVLNRIKINNELGEQYKGYTFMYYIEDKNQTEINAEIKPKIALLKQSAYISISESSDIYTKLLALTSKFYSLRYDRGDGEIKEGLFEVGWSLKMGDTLCECFTPMGFNLFDVFTVNKDFSNLKEEFYSAYELFSELCFDYNNEKYYLISKKDNYTKHFSDISDYAIAYRGYGRYVAKRTENSYNYYELTEDCKEAARAFVDTMDTETSEKIWRNSTFITKIILTDKFEIEFKNGYTPI